MSGAVDHIDTAQYYGPGVANELIREALHPYPDNLALVSKVGARRDRAGGWLPYSDPDQLRAGIEDNLRSLGVGQLAVVNLRVTGGEPDRRFDDQLAAMIQAREDGLIGGVGLSNVTLERLRRALERTPIACVQNPLNLADRSSMPVLRECARRGIAFVPFFPLGSAFAPDNPVLGNPAVRATAGRLGADPGPGRARLDPGPGPQRPADTRHLLGAAPGGEPRRRRRHARRAGAAGPHRSPGISTP